MGCVRYDSTIVVCKHGEQPCMTKIGDFVQLDDALEYKVWDSHAKRFVKILNVINNPPTCRWLKITLTGDKILYVTDDHYLPVNDVRTRAEDIVVGMTIPSGIDHNDPTKEPELLTVEKIEIPSMVEKSYCLETETDMFDINGVQSHNCRTRVIGNVHDPKRQWSYGRGNLFPVTLNLPYIALEAKEYVESHPDIAIMDKFYTILTERMNDCFGQLLERFEIVAKRKAKNYPFLMGQGLYLDADKLHPDDEIREVIKHGTLTVGFIGLAETLVVLTGKHHGESEESWNIGYKIIEYMNNMCKQKAEDTKLNFSLMGSPAEGCAGRLLRCTRDRFGTIEGVTNHEFVTNSHHLPVYFPVSAYKKARLEGPFHKLEPAGKFCRR